MRRTLKNALLVGATVALLGGLWLMFTGFDHPDSSLGYDDLMGSTYPLRCDLPIFQAFSDIECAQPARVRLVASVMLVGAGAVGFWAVRRGRQADEDGPGAAETRVTS